MNYDAENKLEQLLARAFDEPARRPEFYRVLLESTVYVVSYTGLPDSGERYLKPGDTLRILSVPAAGNMTVIPFFSSLDRLVDFLQRDGEWIGINARQLFVLTRGNTLVLNPNSDLSKGFDPPEIDALLQTAAHHALRLDTAPSRSCVPTGPPKPYPAGMVDALTTLFAARPQVRAAYVAMGRPDEDSSPQLVLGIDTDADVPTILQEATAVAADTASNPYSSLVAVDMKRSGDDTAAALLRCGICFYERRWGARLSTTAGRA